MPFRSYEPLKFSNFQRFKPRGTCTLFTKFIYLQIQIEFFPALKILHTREIV